MGFADLVMSVDRTVQAHLGAITAIYRPTTGAVLDPVEVTGIFDRNYVLDDEDDHTGVETRTPALWVRREDLPSDPDTDEPIVTVEGIDYDVVRRWPDSLGGLVLVLHRVIP